MRHHRGRARTASLYTYVHTKRGGAHTHTGIPRRLLLQERGGERRSHNTTIPRGVQLTRQQNPGLQRRRTGGTTTQDLVHPTALLRRLLPSRVPHTTTATRGRARNQTNKKEREQCTAQLRGRCCPATAPLLLLPPSVFLVTPPRLIVGTGTARTTPPSAQYEHAHTRGARFGRCAHVEGHRTVGAAASTSVALGGFGEQLLQQALALVATGLVIDPGRGLLRRWGVCGRQQRKEGRRRL